MDPFLNEITTEAASNIYKVFGNGSATKKNIQEVVSKILI